MNTVITAREVIERLERKKLQKTFVLKAKYRASEGEVTTVPDVERYKQQVTYKSRPNLGR